VKPLSPRAVLVTCDDGLLNTLTDMLAVLTGRGSVPCLFFVTAASCSDDPGMLWHEELYHLMRIQPLRDAALQLPPENSGGFRASDNFHSLWWSTVRRASQLHAEARAAWMNRVRHERGTAPARFEKRWRLLNLRELKQLSDAGMSIGAHPRTHPVLSLCGDEEARHEIQDCKAEIESALGHTVWAFAYPFGNPSTMGQREFRLAEQAGFSCAFVNVEYWPGQSSNRYALPRTHVTSDMTLPELTAHLSGFHRHPWRRRLSLLLNAVLEILSLRGILKTGFQYQFSFIRRTRLGRSVVTQKETTTVVAGSPLKI
jgi:peptidoglycan/xylan/chitin deacetylase (PgdA/CDA1 family)